MSTPPDQAANPLRDTLSRMARMGDRTTPVVFAGRDDEFDLLDDAVKCTQEGDTGHTVVIKGVPGAGKTALLNEYAARLLAHGDDEERIVLPVPLQAHDLNNSARALVQRIDESFRELDRSKDWRRHADHWLAKAKVAGDFLSTLATRKRLGEFFDSVDADRSLRSALGDYMAFKLAPRPCTIVLLVDEAQALSDTERVSSS